MTDDARSPTTAAAASEGIFDPRYVRGLFDRMSRSYERMNIAMSFGFSALWRRQLMALVERPEDARDVIDLMTGMGETWAAARRAFPGATLHALDFAPHMIEGAARRNEDRFDGAFVLHCEDILASDLPDGSFDVVISAYGLKTFDEEQSRRLVEEVVRILRPGGRFAFIEVTEPPNRVLAWWYDFYLRRVVPVVGVLLVSDPVEYRMLWRYLRAYGDGARSERAFEHPLLRATRRSHFFGCATSFSGARVD